MNCSLMSRNIFLKNVRKGGQTVKLGESLQVFQNGSSPIARKKEGSKQELSEK